MTVRGRSKAPTHSQMGTRRKSALHYSRFTPGKYSVPIAQKAGWAWRPVSTA